MVTAIILVSLYLTSTGAVKQIAFQTEECPLWTVPINNSCVCADPIGQIVICNPLNKSLSIRFFHCMTADSDMNPVVGVCLYNQGSTLFNHIYFNINTNSTANINEEVCGVYKRKGLMCGQCIKDYGFPVYSYRVDCVKCVDYKYNWLKYIAVAYLPLTVFYLVVIIFRVSANSGFLVGYVTVSQMIATFDLARTYSLPFQFHNSLYKRYNSIPRLVSSGYSIWNLDFFRVSEYFSFCIHPNMSALAVLSLDYMVAIYPMVAVIFTYIMVQKFSYINCFTRTLNKFQYLFKKEWNVGKSLIEAFATLILLSQVKILNVTFNLLTPGFLYHMNGTHGHPHVYNDPSKEYLSKQHLPYFVLAIAMSFVFNFLPFLIICLYPCAGFQKCLNWTKLRYLALSTFMDAFHGYYKHKPFYLRSFPVIYMMAQFANLLIFSCFGFEYYYPMASLLLIVVIILVAIARPYKNKWHNVVTLAMFGAVFTSYITLFFDWKGDIQIKGWSDFLDCLIWVGAIIPGVYGLILCIHGVFPEKISTKIKVFVKEIITSWNSEVPHSLECDQENTPLLPG